MKNKKGVTLISLVITIIVLMILSTVAIYSGIEIVKISNLTKFTTEMKILQTQINSIYDQYTENKTINIDEASYKGEEILNIEDETTDEITAKKNQIFKELSKDSEAQIYPDEIDQYKYWSNSLIQKLGIEGVEGSCFVNVKRRSIVSYEGLKYDGKRYYTLSQLPDSLYNVEYDNPNTGKPTFDLTINKISESKWQIDVSNIQYSEGYIERWQVKYKLEKDDYWSTTENMSFFINRAGNYLVKIENENIQSEEKRISAYKDYGYVKNGLMLHYDAIDNTRNGHNKKATTWEDLSGNENDGALQNFDENSWSKNYLTFDGINDWVKIKKMNYENITIEAVVEYNEKPENNEEMGIVSNLENGGCTLSNYASEGNTPYNKFTINVNGTYYSRISDKEIEKNGKYMLTGSYDGTTMKFWENGIENQEEIIGSIQNPNNNTIMVLGGNPSGSECNISYFNGKIYSIRIYDRALSDEEVEQNYKIDMQRFNTEEENQ